MIHWLWIPVAAWIGALGGFVMGAVLTRRKYEDDYQ